MKNKLAFILIGFLACLSLGGTVANGLLLVDFDGQECVGLDGTHDSICYRVTEIERHLHSNERWFGLAGIPDAEIHRADRIGVTVTPFQMDAGNLTWGTWLQVLGSSDTPADDTNPYFDLHKIYIIGIEHATSIHFIQMGAGASGADALMSGNYSETVYTPQNNQSTEYPIDIQTRRYPAGTKFWIRVLSVGNATGTVDFFIGLHEYEG